MKKSLTLAAALLLTLGSAACSSRPKQTAQAPAPVTETTVVEESTLDANTTQSGTTSSLGASSSGQGH